MYSIDCLTSSQDPIVSFVPLSCLSPCDRSSNKMLLWTSLLCLLSAHLAVSQFAKPEILADYDPATVLKPTNNNLGDKDSSSSRHLIRGLLMARQTGCPVGYDECADPASGRSVLQPHLSLASSPPFVPTYARFGDPFPVQRG